MRRIREFFGTAYGAAVAVCLILAGWALWTGGVFDTKIAAQVRSSSVYADDTLGLDQTAAEKIIGNRRLVVILLSPGSQQDLGDVCDDVRGAADGTLVLILQAEDEEFDSYGCALFPEAEDENFGKAFVAESLIGQGIDGFVDAPLDALKVIAVNYDRLVRSGAVLDGARTVSPSFPRFLLATIVVGAVIIGALILYTVSRRAGTAAARRQAVGRDLDDAQAELSAQTAVLAQQIIRLDSDIARSKAAPVQRQEIRSEFQQLAGEYAALTLRIAGNSRELSAAATVDAMEQAAELSTRCEVLTGLANRG